MSVTGIYKDRNKKGKIWRFFDTNDHASGYGCGVLLLTRRYHVQNSTISTFYTGVKNTAYFLGIFSVFGFLQTGKQNIIDWF